MYYTKQKPQTIYNFIITSLFISPKKNKTILHLNQQSKNSQKPISK